MEGSMESSSSSSSSALKYSSSSASKMRFWPGRGRVSMDLD